MNPFQAFSTLEASEPVLLSISLRGYDRVLSWPWVPGFSSAFSSSLLQGAGGGAESLHPFIGLLGR